MTRAGGAGSASGARIGDDARMSTSERARRLFDLSRVIEDGMVTDPRLSPARVFSVWTREQSAARYAPGVSFQMAGVEMVQATGTYIDTPWHRHASDAGGAALPGVWDIPIEKVADLQGVCVDARAIVARGERRLDVGLFEGVDVRGRAVLVCTGYDKFWSEHRYRDGSHPFLTEGAAKALVERGAALYGVDTLNADDFTDMRRPVHTILLGAPPELPPVTREGAAERPQARATPGVCIVENLTGLEALLEDAPSERSGARVDTCASRAFRFSAAPVKVKGIGSFPVRAWAGVEE